MKKLIFNLIIIIIAAIALLLLVFFTSGVDELLRLFKNMEYAWIAVAFGCMVMYWLFDGMILQLLCRVLIKKQRFLNTLKLTMIGQFFNAVTPSATGGQPIQAYVMAKDGVSVGHAASILIVRSILYQSVLALYTLLVVALKTAFFVSVIPHFFSMYMIGLAINLSVISLYIIFAFNKTLAHKIIMGLFRFLKRIRFLKKLEKFQSKLEVELQSFSESAVVFKRRYKEIFSSILLQVIQLTFHFCIPYFIFLAVQEGKANAWDMIAVQAVITMVVLLIPSPGASGGAEGVGYLFFSMFFKAHLVMPVVLLWRLITYYSSLIFGGLVSVFAPEKPLESSAEPES